MIEVKAKNTRQVFTCTENDIIMFNGRSYQLVTQSFFKDWTNISPVISKNEFNRLLKEGKLLQPYKVQKVTGLIVEYYHFKK